MLAIHRFLLIVARPKMRAPVNIQKSLIEVIRVAKEEAAIMAIVDGMLVGTMGIIKPTWWYSDDGFITERWDFVLPQFWNGPVHKMLLAEAVSIAETAGLEFIHSGRIREARAGMPFSLMMPRVFNPIEHVEGNA